MGTKVGGVEHGRRHTDTARSGRYARSRAFQLRGQTLANWNTIQSRQKGYKKKHPYKWSRAKRVWIVTQQFEGPQ